MVGAVVEQVYKGAVTCSRDNTRRQYPKMLYFYLEMHQTNMRMRSPNSLAGLKGDGARNEEGKERKGKGKKEKMSVVR